jgi:hypothetical protein
VLWSIFNNFMAFIQLYHIMLNIFGAVIFWSLMDTSNCDNSIYNYVFTSLIIKIFFNAIGVLERKNENK